MITKTVRLWTYEEVRLALSTHFGTEVTGVRFSDETGYMVQECPMGQQPHSASNGEASPLFVPAPWDETLQAHERGLGGEPERKSQ